MSSHNQVITALRALWLLSSVHWELSVQKTAKPAAAPVPRGKHAYQPHTVTQCNCNVNIYTFSYISMMKELQLYIQYISLILTCINHFFFSLCIHTYTQRHKYIHMSLPPPAANN